MERKRKYDSRRKNTRYYARILYEQENNQILPSHIVVHHKDGNPMNDRIDNLQLMTRREHTMLHKIGIDKYYSNTWENEIILADAMEYN
jgi:hypothetical protein